MVHFSAGLNTSSASLSFETGPLFDTRQGREPTTKRTIFIQPKMNRLCRFTIFIYSQLLILLLIENSQSLSEEFPSLEYLNDFVTLSGAVYDMNSRRCERSTEEEKNRILPAHINCHTYIKTLLGTEVMVVSSSSTSSSPTNHGKNYIAVCFAGTDSIRDSLLDANVFSSEFGPKRNDRSDHSDDPPISFNPRPDKDVRVHAGFNSAVFGEGLYDRLLKEVSSLLEKFPTHEIVLTGHSLGGADAILLGTAFALDENFVNKNTTKKQISVFNFGCPKTGNKAWIKYANEIPNLGIWRFVLQHDAIPRLPTNFFHVGHTAQINHHKDEVGGHAYYLHYGNEELGFAGLGTAWELESLFPDSMYRHLISHYEKYFKDMTKKIENKGNSSSVFIDHFVRTNSTECKRMEEMMLQENFYLRATRSVAID